jgi:antitoxin YefM
VSIRIGCSLTSAPPPAPHLAILMAMSAPEHVPLADVKNRLSEVVERLEREHGRVVITKHGRPAAVMLSLEDLESLEETLEILSDPVVMNAIREAEGDVAAGRTGTISKEEALAIVKRR